MNAERISMKDIQTRMRDKCCLVAGDIILDKYMDGSVGRISPEAPIPVVKIKEERYVLGGSANVACNIRGYHTSVFLCGLLGEDREARIVRELLEKQDILFFGISSHDRCTTTKTRITGMNQQLVRVDREDVFPLTTAQENAFMEQIFPIADKLSVIVISDYNKGLCTPVLCEKLIGLAHRLNIPVIVDPKSKDWAKYRGADFITPNFSEFTIASGANIPDEEEAILRTAPDLMVKYNISHLLVTRSGNGMTYISNGQHCATFRAIQQEVYDVSGAGDTVVATIAALLSAGYSPPYAIEFSNYAAGLSVSKSGTCPVTLEDVFSYIRDNVMLCSGKICDREAMRIILRGWRAEHKKLVFTNGCFDILHAGHVEYLNAARNLGDKLIVGLNTDKSVRKNKGPSRPINNQSARAQVLSALQAVDMVVFFDEDTPFELIRTIEPDILVKGGDYQPDEVVGKEFAGELKLIPFVAGYSTTKILQKLTNPE